MSYNHIDHSMDYAQRQDYQVYREYHDQQVQRHQTYIPPDPLLVPHELYPAPPHLGIETPLAWPPDGTASSSFSAPCPPSAAMSAPSASFPMAYSSSASTHYSSSAPSYPLAQFSAYDGLPSPAPFPPPRLSPPRLPHNLHTLAQPSVQMNEHHNGGLHLMHSNGHRPTLAGSLDPSTGIFYRSPEHPRLRTAQACEKCRTRKAKCSGEHPSCKRCTTRGLVCEYAKEGRVRGPNKPKVKGEAKDGEAGDAKKAKKTKMSIAVDDEVENKRGKDKASGKVKSSRTRIKEESSSPSSQPRRTVADSDTRSVRLHGGSSSPSEPDFLPAPAPMPTDRPLSTSMPLDRALSMAVGLPLSMSEHRASRARPPNLILHTPSHHFSIDTAPRSASFHSTPPHSGVSVGFETSPPLQPQSLAQQQQRHQPHLHGQSHEDFTPTSGTPLYGAHALMMTREYLGDGEYEQALGRQYEQSQERFSEQQHPHPHQTQPQEQRQWPGQSANTNGGAYTPSGTAYTSSSEAGYVGSGSAGTYVASDGSGTTYVASSSEGSYSSERPGTGSSGRPGSGAGMEGQEYRADGFVGSARGFAGAGGGDGAVYAAPVFGYRGGEACVESVG